MQGWVKLHLFESKDVKNQMIIIRAVLSCILMMLFFSVAYGESSPSKQEIDSLAQKTLSEWDIPGLGIAVVHKGSLVCVSGYGIKRRGSTEPVTEETIFQIASLTKAFTAASVGMLVEEGKLNWEKPIQEYLPDFQLKDEYASRAMTLQDLLSHRTGLPGTSKECWRLWYHTDRTAEDLIQRLKYVDPAYSFRSHFSYNNMAYVVASKVVEKVSSTPWTQFCEQRIFSPLGMKRTHFSYSFLKQDKNVASAHLCRFMQKEPISWENWENMAAAGGINSCAQDMASWMLYCLSSPKVLQESQKPKSVMEPEGLLGPFSVPTWSIYAHGKTIVTYGFGWFMYSLGDKTVLFHIGMSDGMHSVLAIVPEEQLGIVILTNQAPHLGAACLANELLDKFLHQPYVSWHKKGHLIVTDMFHSLKNQKEAFQAIKRRLAPTLALSEYAGIYEHPAYGTVSISVSGNKLEGELWTKEKEILDCYNGDTFEVLGPPSEPSWIFEFELTQDKKNVQALKIPNLGVFEKKGRLDSQD